MSILDTCPIKHYAAKTVMQIALDAAEIITKIYATDFATEYKPGDEPVTIADKQSDTFIVSSLKKAFPNDRILSEEHGLYTPENPDNKCWFIDPIDGTKEFIAKNGEFATQIGLAVDEKLQFGVVYQPIGKNMYIAASGEGCWWHSPEKGWVRLQVKTPDFNDLKLAVSRSHPCGIGQEVHTALHGTGTVVHGGVGLKLMAIAKQTCDYYINNSNKTKAWDVAAPEILFTEAGGYMSDITGVDFCYDPTNYTHKHGVMAIAGKELYEKVIAMTKKVYND